MKQNRNEIILFCIIVLQPILDVIAFFQENGKYALLSFTVRTLILVCSTIYVIIKLNFEDRKKILCIYLILFIYSILHIYNVIRLDNLNIMTDFANLVRTMYFPVVSINLCAYLKMFPRSSEFLKKALCVNIYLIFLVILLNIISGDVVNTYAEGYGFRGWFYNSNSQSVILSISSILFVFYMMQTKKAFIKIISVLIMFFLLYTNGTTACYIMIVPMLAEVIFVDFFGKYKSKCKIMSILCVLLLIATFVFYNFSSSYMLESSANNSYKETEKEITEKEIIDNDISESDSLQKEENIDVIYSFKIEKYKEKNIRRYFGNDFVNDYGADVIIKEIGDNYSLEKFVSNRYRKKLVSKVVYHNSDFYTRFVGFDFSLIKKYDVDMENDISAILYYYGYLGFGLFVAGILYIIYIFIKKFFFSKGYFDYEFMVLGMAFCVSLIAAEFSGSLLRRPNASIYFAMIIALLFDNICIKGKANEK